MNKLIVKSIVALMLVALCSSSAMAQLLDTRPYFGTSLPYHDFNTMAVRLTVPSSGLGWALSQRGKRIGRGECTDLVSQHLNVSYARQGDFRVYRRYVWGAIPTNGIRPGDIIQFERCKFRYTFPNSWYEIVMDHHTAIIVGANGSKLQILHQNAPIGGPVKLEALDLSKKTQGTYVIWRPVRF